MTNIFQQTEVIAAIIGAVVGGIIGVASFVLGEILKSSGKIIVFINRTKVEFFEKTVPSVDLEPSAKNVTKIRSIHVDIEVYNQSDIPKTLGDFKIEVSNKKVKKYFPAVTHKILKGDGVVPYPQVIAEPTQIVFPKQPQKITCSSNVEQIEFSALGSKFDIYLLASFPDKKKFRAKVYEVNLNQASTKG